MPTERYDVRLTDEQVEAINKAFPNDARPFSDKLRDLIAGGLALHLIEWPITPKHGGKRLGAGRKKSGIDKR